MCILHCVLCKCLVIINATWLIDCVLPWGICPKYGQLKILFFCLFWIDILSPSRETGDVLLKPRSYTVDIPYSYSSNLSSIPNSKPDELLETITPKQVYTDPILTIGGQNYKE